MIQQLTSPSNYSVNQNALCLNGSSMISPSQSNFDSGFKKQLIEFEQFEQHTQNSEDKPNKQNPGKKKLTIRIDESYEFTENTDTNKQKIAFHKSNEKYHESITTPMSDFNLISPIENSDGNMTKYYQLVREMQNLESKLEEKDNLVVELTARLENKNEELEREKNQTRKLEALVAEQNEQLRERDLKLVEYGEMMKKLHEKFVESQDERKEQDHKIKELSRINIKLKNMQKEMNAEIKISEKKVRDLQKQAQRTICMATQQSINKMKESSLKSKDPYQHSYSNSQFVHNNKENNLTNGGRKSLQRKKGNGALSTGHLHNTKKSSRIPSSTCNILTKKLMQK